MTQSYPPIHLGAPGEEISIKDLRAIKLRFKKMHQIRMHYIYDFLQPRQQIFLDLLPLIFHVNSPLLPGYISSGTPSGLYKYRPGNRTLKAAGKFIKNFTYADNRSTAKDRIEGLFLMGSVGSIAYSKTSDMDIWLCHQPDLDQHEIKELADKAHAVENWAATLGLEVHFFLMNSKQFRLGLDAPISSESSGETQHYLLLEEFYRTSIYIAGKDLAWWLVPPHQEHAYRDYLDHLTEQRFIDENDFIDFGGLETVPAEEFISATVWHIYKSLHSPHKSLLKLLLMECYASEYPDPQWICRQIKEAVYQGNFPSADLDPYVLIYLKVEAYLQNKHSVSRLALARQNFYFKITESSDEAINSQALAYREKYLRYIAERCHWPSNILPELKQHRYWDIKQAITEHEIILQQLTHCFRMITGFANEHINQTYRYSRDLKLIGRKLYSFLDKKPGKIELITTRAAVHGMERELSVIENRHASNSQGWFLYFEDIPSSSAGNPEPVLRRGTLIEILVWLIINGFYQPEQPLRFGSKWLHLSNGELQSILYQLNGFIKSNFDENISLTHYHSANTLRKTLVIINMGFAIPDELDKGLCLISERSDVFSYGMERKCFVHAIDRISISSWNEVTSSHHEGIDGFFECLTGIINQYEKPIAADSLTIVCHTPVRAKSIIQRVGNVFAALVNLFAKKQPGSAPRYILNGGAHYYIFQVVDQHLGFLSLQSKEQVFAELSRPQLQFSPFYFDEEVLNDTPVPLIYRLNKPRSIQFFYFATRPTTVTIYIIDERGALFCRQHTETNPDRLINQYSIFLKSTLGHIFFDALINIEYYEVRKNSLGSFSHHPMEVKSAADNTSLNLRITGITHENNPGYLLHCDDHVFSSHEHGGRIFQAVYRHIIGYRKNNLNYPVHLTDIDLPISAFGVACHEELQTIHYLNMKQKIEDKMNGRSNNYG
ncbi:MAG: class I adenylate cyclase [Methylosarcina sp.]